MHIYILPLYVLIWTKLHQRRTSSESQDIKLDVKARTFCFVFFIFFGGGFILLPCLNNFRLFMENASVNSL